MHGLAHQRGDRGVDHAVALEAAAAAKGTGHQRHREMAAAACARVARVARAVVDDLERARRERALERGPHLHHDRFAHTLASVQPRSQAPARAATRARVSHSSCRVIPAKVSSVSPNILKLTQARSLA